MEYYDSISKGYSELHGEEQRKKIAIIKKYLKIKKSDKLLDVGCGTGLSSDFDCEVYGLEPSKKLLDQARLKNKVRAKAEDIPFPDNFFDIVISITAIHNFEDIEKGIREMKRVGKQRFVFSLLKRSPKIDEIRKIIKGNFKITKEIEEDKDIILFLDKE